MLGGEGAAGTAVLGVNCSNSLAGETFDGLTSILSIGRIASKAKVAGDFFNFDRGFIGLTMFDLSPASDFWLVAISLGRLDERCSFRIAKGEAPPTEALRQRLFRVEIE
jgi:hypothetical protein